MSDIVPIQEDFVDVELAAADPEAILAEPPDALDISAELAAPPRRKLPWLTLLLAGGLVAGLGFVGGVLVEKGQAPASGQGSGRTFGAGGRTGSALGSGFGSGGGSGSGSGFGGGFGAGFGGGGAGGGATVGTVKLVDGSTIYVTDTSGNIVKVTTGGSTKVSIAQSGKVAQLKPGATVTVRGTADANGDVAATTVTQVGG